MNQGYIENLRSILQEAQATVISNDLYQPPGEPRNEHPSDERLLAAAQKIIREGKPPGQSLNHLNGSNQWDFGLSCAENKIPSAQATQSRLGKAVPLQQMLSGKHHVESVSFEPTPIHPLIDEARRFQHFRGHEEGTPAWGRSYTETWGDLTTATHVSATLGEHEQNTSTGTVDRSTLDPAAPKQTVTPDNESRHDEIHAMGLDAASLNQRLLLPSTATATTAKTGAVSSAMHSTVTSALQSLLKVDDTGYDKARLEHLVSLADEADELDLLVDQVVVPSAQPPTEEADVDDPLQVRKAGNADAALQTSSMGNDDESLPTFDEMACDFSPSLSLYRLQSLMKESRKTQELLQDWDEKNGLPRSHSVTMMHTNRSRTQLEEGKILPKWNGDPLIDKNGKVNNKKRQHKHASKENTKKKEKKNRKPSLPTSSKVVCK